MLSDGSGRADLTQGAKKVDLGWAPGRAAPVPDPEDPLEQGATRDSSIESSQEQLDGFDPHESPPQRRLQCLLGSSLADVSSDVDKGPRDSRDRKPPDSGDVLGHQAPRPVNDDSVLDCLPPVRNGDFDWSDVDAVELPELRGGSVRYHREGSGREDR